MNPPIPDKDALARLERQVAERLRLHAERKERAEREEEQRRRAAQRVCAPETGATTPNEIAAVVMASLVGSFPAVDPVKAHAYDWETIIKDELERNRIPERYRYEMTEWGCRGQESTFKLLRRILVGTGAIAAMIGLRGTGKTTIAIQLVIERCWQDCRILRAGEVKGALARWMPYRKMADLIALLKPLYADFGSVNSESLIISRESLANADLLIIDEVHDCDDQKMKGRILTDLCDRRYSKMKDTVLIANQTDEEFRATTSDSVLSRISEHGLIIPCQWASFRAKDPGMPAPRHAQP